ncbi:hypothetical protein [Syntrophomonas curvata]
MRKYVDILALLALAVMLAVGCQSSADKGDKKENPPAAVKKVTVAGIGLGDSGKDVKQKLGMDYMSESMDGDWFGEPASRWLYDDDVEVIMGDETGKVLQVNLYDDDYTAPDGCRVGDKAEKVLPAYADKYPLAQDHFEGNELPGWFVVEEGVWLIFNFKDDDTLVNQPIAPEDKVESVHLVYESFMD